MEYKIFNKVRHSIKIGKKARFIISGFLFLGGFMFFFIPALPGFILVIAGIALISPARTSKFVQKIRKSLIYLIKNIHNKDIIKYKFNDIKKYVKSILIEIKKYYKYN